MLFNQAGALSLADGALRQRRRPAQLAAQVGHLCLVGFCGNVLVIQEVHHQVF
jgi:hypothetical protein